MHTLLFYYYILLFWACFAHARPTQNLLKRATLHSSCDDRKTQIQSSLQAVVEMGHAAANALDWILYRLDRNSNEDEIIRIQDMVETAFGIGLQTSRDVKRAEQALKKLKESMQRTGDVSANDVTFICDPDFLHRKHNGQAYTGAVPDKFKARWSSVHNQWLLIPTGSLDPPSSARATHREFLYAQEFARAGRNTPVREMITLYPVVFQGWEISREPYFFKTHQELLESSSIDYFAAALTMDIYHELTHTRKGGSSEDWLTTARGGGWNGVLSLARRDASKALTNAESQTYFSVAMYLNEWNWATGRAQPLNC